MKEYMLGIDLGGTNIECGLVDRRGNLKIRRSCPTEKKKGAKTVLLNILSIARAVMLEAKRRKYSVLGIGIGTPGALDKKTGHTAGGAPNIPGWKGVPLVPALRKEFALPTFGSNDVTLYTLAEAAFGAGKGAKEIVCLALGTGIGGGIVVGGQVYTGTMDGAGEVGHMTVKLDGKKCKCGSFGCLERYASATAIVRMAKVACLKDKRSLILELAGNDPSKITAKTVFDAAKKRDRTAKSIVEKVGWFLGAGIANLINLLNPEMVIIGGGVAKAGAILLRIIRKATKTYGLELNRRNTKIVLGKLGSDAGLVGAATLAWQEIGCHKVSSKL